MFAEQGLSLVNVNVSQQDVNGRREHDTEGYRSTASGRAEAPGQPLPLTGAMTGAGTAHGLVDYYI